jgi:nitrite reductase/ring-hydroxylating ferredoxin subunit
MRFQRLDKLINIEDGYRRRFKIDSLDVELAREGDDVTAFSAVCPHQEQPLEDGCIENGVIYCPRHNYGFDLRTGQHIEQQCASLTIYTVHYEGNDVGILMAY